MSADDLGRGESPPHDVDAQLESPFDHAGHDAGTHHEHCSRIEALVHLIGLKHRADPDRPAGTAPAFDRIQRSRGVQGHLDEPDPSAHQGFERADDIPGVPVSDDPEEPGGSIPSGHRDLLALDADA